MKIKTFSRYIKNWNSATHVFCLPFSATGVQGAPIFRKRSLIRAHRILFGKYREKDVPIYCFSQLRQETSNSCFPLRFTSTPLWEGIIFKLVIWATPSFSIATTRMWLFDHSFKKIIEQKKCCSFFYFNSWEMARDPSQPFTDLLASSALCLV